MTRIIIYMCLVLRGSCRQVHVVVEQLPNVGPALFMPYFTSVSGTTSRLDCPIFHLLHITWRTQHKRTVPPSTTRRPLRHHHPSRQHRHKDLHFRHRRGSRASHQSLKVVRNIMLGNVHQYSHHFQVLRVIGCRRTSKINRKASKLSTYACHFINVV